MPLYSVKMRASAADRHVSGAERIVEEHEVAQLCADMGHRALAHPKATPDEIHLTVRRIDASELVRVPFLPTTVLPTASPQEARDTVLTALAPLTEHAQRAWTLLTEARDMRGAILLDAATGQRLEPDHQRGVRVTGMDAASSNPIGGKHRVLEAQVLAAKVAHRPDVLAEICISDDPDYTTGYLATAQHGYQRLPHIKEPGSAQGGRVFLVRGDDVAGLIEYLEHTPVVVEGDAGDGGGSSA